MLRNIFIFFFFTLLTGCSYLYGDYGVVHNRDTEYLNAQSVPPLRIPPGMSSSTIESSYPVSERVYPKSKTKVNLVPPNLSEGHVETLTPAVPVQQAEMRKSKTIFGWFKKEDKTVSENKTQPEKIEKPAVAASKPRTIFDWFRKGSNDETSSQTDTKVAENTSTAPPAKKPRTLADMFKQQNFTFQDLFGKR